MWTLERLETAEGIPEAEQGSERMTRASKTFSFGVERERSKVAESETEWNRAKFFQCPSCRAELALDVSVNVRDVRLSTGDKNDWKDYLTEEQKRIVAAAESAGLVDAFAQALEGVNVDGRPSSPAKFLLTWLSMATPRELPTFALTQFRRQFPESKSQRMGFIATQGVGAVLLNDKIRWFVPTKMITGQPAKTGNGLKRVRTPADQSAFNDWVKTRNGYVAGRGLLFDELRGKRPGQFETTVR